MLTTQRKLALGLILAMVPMGIVTTTAPPAKAECTSSGYATVCAQGDVRGADGVPRAATPVVPYPCEYDWYCDTGWDLDIAWDPGRPGIGGPGGPGRPGGIGPR
ncbi:hypothetical protein ABQF34_15095 [Mycolicibacterium boenickei]